MRPSLAPAGRVLTSNAPAEPLDSSFAVTGHVGEMLRGRAACVVGLAGKKVQARGACRRCEVVISSCGLGTPLVDRRAHQLLALLGALHEGPEFSIEHEARNGVAGAMRSGAVRSRHGCAVGLLCEGVIRTDTPAGGL